MNEENLKQFALAVYQFMNEYHYYAFNENEINYYAEELTREIKSGKKNYVELEEMKNCFKKTMNPSLQVLIAQFEQFINGGDGNESTQN